MGIKETASIEFLQSALAAETKRREEAEERLNGSILEYVDLVGRLNDAERRVQDYSAKLRSEKADNARLRDVLSVCEDENQKYLKDKLNAEAALEKLRDMQIVETLPIIDAALAKPEGGA